MLKDYRIMLQLYCIVCLFCHLSLGYKQSCLRNYSIQTWKWLFVPVCVTYCVANCLQNDSPPLRDVSDVNNW